MKCTFWGFSADARMVPSVFCLFFLAFWGVATVRFGQWQTLKHRLLLGCRLLLLIKYVRNQCNLISHFFLLVVVNVVHDGFPQDFMGVSDTERLDVAVA